MLTDLGSISQKDRPLKELEKNSRPRKRSYFKITFLFLTTKKVLLMMILSLLKKITVASTLGLLRTIATASSLSGSRPNIIFVLTDDQGFGDLACHGNTEIEIPNLDKMHNISTRMDQHYAAPTCSPTRAQIMTGNHEVFGGITHTILERDVLSPKVITVADTLKKSGYATGLFGKWHLGIKMRTYHKIADLKKCLCMVLVALGSYFLLIVPTLHTAQIPM
jgi:hypothetical protein